MPYATTADLVARLGHQRMVQLTDVGLPQTGDVVAAVAQTALDDASAQIDGYLQGRYALPLASPPGLLRVACVDLAHLRLLGDTADEAARNSSKPHLDYLVRVARGEIALLPPSEPQATAGAGAVLFAPGQKTFAREA